MRCVLCGDVIVGYGNNPAPLSDEGRCCDHCDATKVIPHRIALAIKGSRISPEVRDGLLARLNVPPEGTPPVPR